MADLRFGMNVNEALKDALFVVRLRGMARFKIRLWIGAKLISLGAWIAGFGGSEVETDDA